MQKKPEDRYASISDLIVALRPMAMTRNVAPTGSGTTKLSGLRAVPESVGPFLTDAKGSRLLALGTDGFGRSETRKALRRFFEVDAEHVTVAALHALAELGALDRSVVARAIKDLGVDPERPAPWTV